MARRDGSSGFGIAILALVGAGAIGLGRLCQATGAGTQVLPGGQLNVLAARGTWLPAFMIDTGVVCLVLALILLVSSVRERVSIWRFARRYRRRAK